MASLLWWFVSENYERKVTSLSPLRSQLLNPNNIVLSFTSFVFWSGLVSVQQIASVPTLPLDPLLTTTPSTGMCLVTDLSYQQTNTCKSCCASITKNCNSTSCSTKTVSLDRKYKSYIVHHELSLRAISFCSIMSSWPTTESI